jgi:glycosyltransferase involved in cell wall biosynthesis
VTPRVSVVVPSHERPLRLSWLLNALEDQTLPAEEWEIVVVFDDVVDASAELLAEHPLAQAGRLRAIRLEAGTGSPSRQRNVGWRAARAPVIAFTDDDCRPEPTWLERLFAVAEASPGAIVQGRTRPDPFEADVIGKTPLVRTLTVDPPGPFAQTANILYPRDLLERLDGFYEEGILSGEDTDLYLRARETGAAYVAAPDAVVNHAVETYSLRGMMRLSMKWQHLPNTVSRHPSIRDQYRYGIFWRPSHAELTAALLGMAVFGRRRWAPLLFLPYLRHFLPLARTPPHRWPRLVAEVPTRVVIDLTEFVALARGSVRYRTLFL